MAEPRKTSTHLSLSPGVVGTVHSAKSLAAALRLAAGAIDFVELRVDAFAAKPAALLSAAKSLRVPAIVTVRREEEGGAAALSASRRRELFEEFLPVAAMIDVELQSAPELAPVIRMARERKIAVIFSHHDFTKTPPLAKLRDLTARARRHSADIFKIATTTPDARSLGALLAILTDEKSLPLSVMGMGACGKLSRLLCAACGSVLNYGFLVEPNASGQWPALLLKKRIAEVCTSAIL